MGDVVAAAIRLAVRDTDGEEHILQLYCTPMDPSKVVAQVHSLASSYRPVTLVIDVAVMRAAARAVTAWLGEDEA